MDLKQAIKLLQLDLDDPGSVAIEDLNTAQELGIEALKWRQESEQFDPSLKAFPLPGQTEE